MTMTTHDNPALEEARQQARASYEELVRTYRIRAGDEEDPDDDRPADEVEYDLLSIMARPQWLTLNDASAMFIGERVDGLELDYMAELAWGGPAVRMLWTTRNDAPTEAYLEYQAWGEPWVRYDDPAVVDNALLLRIAEDIWPGF